MMRAGGETGSGDNGSGDCVMDASYSGGGSGIDHTRGTGNSGYSGVVSGMSVAPAADVGQFTPKTDLAPIIIMVAASTAPIHVMNSVVFAASARANDNSSGCGVISRSLLTCCSRMRCSEENNFSECLAPN